ncbi:hypothetical protein KP509_20G014400 [Ceratopteris richardii]|nr:hypothetical protein KP509_20G014400 [Ceratopteris richardii]
MTEKELKSFRFFPGNSPPTAAAMAIVGTAAQNFCKMQSQSQGKKASFSFWSGYEVRAPPMSSSSTEIAEKI